MTKIAGARIVWQAQTRDDIVIANIIDQLIRTSTAKQHLVKSFFSKSRWHEPYFDEFISHLITLYDISEPLITLGQSHRRIYEDFLKEEPSKIKLVEPSIKLYTELLKELKKAGIWSIRKSPKIDDSRLGGHAVRGI